MAFVETPATPLSDNQDTIPAATANVWKRDIARSIDGTGGSDGVPYTPSTVIDIAGTAGLRLSGTGAAERLRYGSHSVTRTSTCPLVNTTTGVVLVANNALAASEVMTSVLDRMPDGATLTAVEIYHNRADGSPLPGTRVTARLNRTDVTTGTTTTLVGPTADATSTLPAYEQHHAITFSGLTEVVDSTKYVYWIRVDGEVAPNAVTTTVYAPRVTLTVTSQDEAP